MDDSKEGTDQTVNPLITARTIVLLEIIRLKELQELGQEYEVGHEEE